MDREQLVFVAVLLSTYPLAWLHLGLRRFISVTHVHTITALFGLFIAHVAYGYTCILHSLAMASYSYFLMYLYHTRGPHTSIRMPLLVFILAMSHLSYAYQISWGFCVLADVN